MTVDEAAAVIGGPPGWYDGVAGIDTSEPPHKGYRPSWCGSNGVIALTLDAQGRVTGADFYPGQVRIHSGSRWACERWTRNAFGTGRTELVVATAGGAWVGLLLGCPLVLAALGWRSMGFARGAFGVCLLGTAASLALLVLVAGVLTADDERGFRWVGASASGLLAFAVGSVLAGRRRPS
jgi:hypothetical protein